MFGDVERRNGEDVGATMKEEDQRGSWMRDWSKREEAAEEKVGWRQMIG